ncbi:MAG: class I SAM-dependent methyltransferase [Actinobacteria bacterium]|nr:class I SAM-dependent methyltransferase [Actinomycetota bacterium]
MKTDNYSKHTSKNPLKQFFINNFFKTLIGDLKNLKIETVLDVGCGEGFSLNKLRENKIGKTYEGIDFSKDAILLGKKMYSKLNLKQGNAYKLNYKNNSFDLVLCTEVLEHLEKPEKALKELIRVSKKYLILSVPNEPYFYLFNYTQWGKDIGHINKWTMQGFTKLVKRQKVKILEKHAPFPWTMLLLKKIAFDK